MKVLKFGGTSVGSAERMQALVPLIHNDEPKIVVMSAMAGTTNALVAFEDALQNANDHEAGKVADQLKEKYDAVVGKLYITEKGKKQGEQLIEHHFSYLRSLIGKEYTKAVGKVILATGELLSTTLFHYYLDELNIPSVLLPALEFMRTDEHGEPDMKNTKALLEKELKKYPSSGLFITQGYICRNAQGQVDNLKRGGGDYTATIVGAVINAEEIQIWTDIDGMHNNDPRVVGDTYPIRELSFEEAGELAYFGAKILHPTCIQPAQKSNTPVRLLNTMNPKAPGTLISAISSGDHIKAVAAKDGITAIRVKSGRMLLAYGFLRAVFEIFEKYKTPIDIVTTSEVATSLSIDNTENLDRIASELKEFCEVEVDSGLTIICIVGSFTAEKQGYALKVFNALRNIPIRMISYGGSENNISVLVDTQLKAEALMALNEDIFHQEMRVQA